MNIVSYGRRKGQTKDLQNDGLQTEVDLNQVTVLSKTDWERIERQLNRKKIQEELVTKIREEREEQKRKSKEIIKSWGNTIAGQRQRKLEARKIREQKDEEEKKQIDLEEEKYRAQLRKEAIEKAKTQQYYQTDRVKTFHSALILTEVLKEREAQLELKELKKKAMGDQDSEWLTIAKNAYEKSIQDDHEKARLRLEATQATKDFQLTQINEHLKHSDKQKEVGQKEAEELAKLAIQFKIEKERLDNIRREERLNLLEENKKQKEDIAKLKQLQVQQAEEEDEECRVFATAKRKMMKLRAEKEKQIHDEKQAHLERIRSKLEAQMKEKISDEEDRIRKTVHEREEKRLEEEREKEIKLLKEIKAQAEHRNMQLKDKELQLKKKKQEELEMVEMRRAADELFRQNEIKRQEFLMGKQEDLSSFRINQHNERINREENVKRQQLALDKANAELLAKEEAQFQEYAKKVIDHCREGGRNVYPLVKAATEGAGGGLGPVFPGKGGIRPSYMVSDTSGVQMPHYQRETTNETKECINGKNPTKNRLGFVW